MARSIGQDRRVSAMKASTPQAPAKAEQTKPDVDASEIMQRIERLEQRLEDSILGDDGLAAVKQDVERDLTDDPLRRAADKPNVRQTGRKV